MTGPPNSQFQVIPLGSCAIHHTRHDLVMEESQAHRTAIVDCRVSSRDQIENTSLESQERYCREYAEKNGIRVFAVYVDKGESAKTADRTEFLKAISFCTNKKNNVDYFIVYKLDR